MTPEREFEMQVEGLAADVLQLLVSDGLSLQEAMDQLYNSRTFHALERPESGLYFQSPVYVYDTLKEEISSHRLL